MTTNRIHTTTPDMQTHDAPDEHQDAEYAVAIRQGDAWEVILWTDTLGYADVIEAQQLAVRDRADVALLAVDDPEGEEWD